MQLAHIVKRVFFGAFIIVAIVVISTTVFVFIPTGGGKSFSVYPREGVGTLSSRLEKEGIVRSGFALQVLARLEHVDGSIKAGNYRLEKNLTPDALLQILKAGPPIVEVLIPEGSSIRDIDQILAQNGLITVGEFVSTARLMSSLTEGYLFPDTYHFSIGMKSAEMLGIMRDNFARKTSSVIPSDPQKARDIVILASILEKEVRTDADRRIVAGIIQRRLAQNMRLQVDASLCYAKRERLAATGAMWKGCYPLTDADKADTSPFNTYLHPGLPPAPIGNPGLSALEAAAKPASSTYLFYISTPSGATVYAADFETHKRNIAKYLQ
jgi:UPF0755 protein